MSDLFNLPESKSPRLLWLEANRIRVDFHEGEHIAHLPGFFAYNEKAGAFGNTEDEAICELAKRLGLRLWNEL